MSIQDDIFDVQFVLDCKPEEAAFNRILSYLGILERKADQYDRIVANADSLLNDLVNMVEIKDLPK